MKKAICRYYVLFFIVLGSCNASKNENDSLISSYEEIEGIWVERFDSVITDDSRYNHDNLLFTEGSEFIYNAYHIDTAGDTLLFKVPPLDNLYKAPWHLIKIAEQDENTVSKLVITVKKGLGFMGKNYPDYYQTVVTYEYYSKEKMLRFNSMSGVIENERNLWMHPPRDFYFEMLEINPFPFVKFPLEIGKKWDWKLGIGDQWSDKRWKEWQGNIENNCQYEITGRKTINTSFGALDCYVIEGHAKSKIGETRLKSFFHTTYGFVVLHYTNINGTQTYLELVGEK